MQDPAKKLRSHPRVELDLCIGVELSEQECIPVRVLDLSAAGMQWACDRPAAERILPLKYRTRPDSTPELAIRLALPGARGMDVQARCRPVFVRRLAENDYRIGVAFTRFYGDSLATLESFIQVCFHTGR